jgi:hypothetical protein
MTTSMNKKKKGNEWKELGGWNRKLGKKKEKRKRKRTVDNNFFRLLFLPLKTTNLM